MPVNPSMEKFQTLEESDDSSIIPNGLQNGSIAHSDLVQNQTSHGRVSHDTANGGGLHIDTLSATTAPPDESDIFATSSPTTVNVQLWLEDDSEIFARFNLSQQIDKILHKNRYVPKICYTISIATIIFLAYAVFYDQWLVLYYYTVALPCLIVIRLVMYTKLKYQYFMLDLCYFVNTVMIIYIWIFPHERELATVLFSFTAGPCGLATILFRNSLVLHSLDKMTSTFLHVLPMLVCFVARWYPDKLSEHWYTPFVPEENFVKDFDYMGIWLWAVPMAFHIAHMFLYLCLIRVVFRPGEDHDYSFRYLSGLSGSTGGCPGKCITCCNTVKPENIQIMYCVMTVVYGVIGFVFIPFWYYWFIAHCLFLSFVLLVVTWNGSRYYLDVFGPKIFK